MKNILYNNLNKNFLNRYYLIMGLLFSVLCKAQTPFPDDTQDVPGVPVDDWIIPFLISSILFGIYVLKKKNKENEISK